MKLKIIQGVIFILSAVALPVFAIGERGHTEVGRITVHDYLQHDTMLPGLSTLFENEDNIRALYSGCAFSDWGFGIGYGDAAEYSHWHPFMERYVALLQKRFPPPWDAEAQRHICFFFGVVVHNISDIPWHFNEDKHKSFLQAGRDMDGAGHSEIEIGCDIFLHAERTLEPSVRTAAWFPLDFLMEVFNGSGQKVTMNGLAAGTLRSRAMFWGGHIVGKLKRDELKERMPWVYDHYFDYYYGGLEHGAAVSAEIIRYYYARLTDSHYFQNTPPYAPYVQHENGYVPRLQISDTHLMAEQPEYNAGGEPLLEVGGTGTEQRIGLIQINLDEVSPCTALNVAQLYLYCAGMRGTVPDTPLSIVAYPMLKPWQAGAGSTDDVSGAAGRPAIAEEACWKSTGAVPEEDYAAESVASITMPPSQKEGAWISLDITNAVERWLAAPAENYGLMLRLESKQQEMPVAQFFSSEAFKGCPNDLCGGKRVAFRPAFVLLKK